MRTVRKGWVLYERGADPVRILVDDHGFVFRRGEGWMRPYDRWILKLLPGTYDYDHWAWEEWWRGTWRQPEWAWIYTATP